MLSAQNQTPTRILYVRNTSEANRQILTPLGIRTAVHPTNTLCQLLVHPKEQVPKLDRLSLIYCIPCKNCPPAYLRYMTRKTSLFPRNSLVVPRRHPRIVVRYDVDLPQGGCGSSAREDTNLVRIWVENGENQKANFVCNNAEGLKKTSQ